MEATQALDVMIERMKAARSEQRVKLAEGIAKDYAAYRYWEGWHAGLMAAKEIADGVKRDLAADPEDER